MHAVEIVFPHSLRQQITRLSASQIFELMDSPRLDLASLSRCQADFLIWLFHADENRARESGDVIGHFTVIMPLRGFAWCKGHDSHADKIRIENGFNFFHGNILGSG